MIALRFFMLAGNVLWSLGMCCPVWSHCNRRGSRPRGEAFAPARPAHHSPRGRASYRAVCTACFCGGPPSGRSSCSCQARTPFAARPRLLQGGVHRLLLWEAQLQGEAGTPTGPAHHSPRGRASYTAVCTAFFCGRSDLGAKLLLAQARAPFAARARVLHSGVHGLLLWEARPRGEAFIA